MNKNLLAVFIAFLYANSVLANDTLEAKDTYPESGVISVSEMVGDDLPETKTIETKIPEVKPVLKSETPINNKKPDKKISPVINEDSEQNLENERNRSSIFVPESTQAPAKLVLGIDISLDPKSEFFTVPVLLDITNKSVSSSNQGIDLQGCRVSGNARVETSIGKIVVAVNKLSCSKYGSKEVKVKGYVVYKGRIGIEGTLVDMASISANRLRPKYPIVTVSENTKLDIIFSESFKIPTY